MKLKLLVFSALFALSNLSIAQAILRAPDPPSGSRIRDVAALGFVPMDKRYEEFTPQEKARLRSGYESMPETDEPPFPRDGMKKIILALRQMSERREAEGRLRVHFLIDENGRALKADIYESPDELLTNAIARVVLGTPFKPAVCSGKPCVMEFALVVQLNLSLGR
jgi:hypothetical protein